MSPAKTWKDKYALAVKETDDSKIVGLIDDAIQAMQERLDLAETDPSERLSLRRAMLALEALKFERTPKHHP